LISSLPRSFDIFDVFNSFDLDIFQSQRSSSENSATYSIRRFGVRFALSRVGEAMLKISLVDNARQRRVIVEGKLIAPWTAELRNACQEARADLRGRELVIEMNHVTTISQEGENVLLELINGGIRFRCQGVFTKHVVKELTRRASRNLRIRTGD
jgi:hypothetical protein